MTKQEQEEFRNKIQDALLSQLEKVSDIDAKSILLNTIHYLQDYDKNNEILNSYIAEHRFEYRNNEER